MVFVLNFASCDVFKNNIDKRIKNLPEIDGLSKETVLSSWMGKFDAIYFGEDENNLGSFFSQMISYDSYLMINKYSGFPIIMAFFFFEKRHVFNNF